VSASPQSPPELRTTARRSLGWQSAATTVVSGLQILVTLVVAAAVAPSEFALLGVAMIIFNAQYLIVGSLGLGAALIHWGDSRRLRDAIDGGFALTVSLGLALALVVAGAAPFIASLFSEGFSNDSVTAVVRLMSLLLFVAALTEIPQALLERRFQFPRRAIAETTGAGMYFLATFALLALGAGIWSVIFGRLLQSGVFLGFLMGFMPIRPRFPPHIRADVLREMVRFGKFIGFSAVLIFVIANLDTVLVGSQIGAGALGSYTLAFTIANIVPTFLSTTLGRVWFPLYVAVKNDRQATRLAVAEALHLILTLMIPVTFGLAVFVPDALGEILGNKWNEAATIVRVLAIYGLARALASMMSTLLTGQGCPQAAVQATVVALILSLAFVIPLLRFDAVGVAAAFAIGQVAAALFLLLKGREYWPRGSQIHARGPIIGATIATLLALPVEWVASTETGVLQLIMFGVSYASALMVFDTRVRRIVLSLRTPASPGTAGAS
jgi:O-antigen/teichoic acid export membrane protein